MSIITEMDNENKNMFAENSKLIHIYNIFILRRYCTHNKLINETIDDNFNIRIYLMFFFDFRGRFYFDSPISPTVNKFCRLIYNYGIININALYHNNTEISKIITTYQSYIIEVRKKKNINKQSEIIDEAIF
jgi:hypothetical protein